MDPNYIDKMIIAYKQNLILFDGSIFPKLVIRDSKLFADEYIPNGKLITIIPLHAYNNPENGLYVIVDERINDTCAAGTSDMITKKLTSDFFIFSDRSIRDQNFYGHLMSTYDNGNCVIFTNKGTLFVVNNLPILKGQEISFLRKHGNKC